MQFDWPLIGHTNIKEYFSRALYADRINHAYLFEGPAQVGKATFARVLAKTLLCEIFGDSASVTTEVESPVIPCNTCRACKAHDFSAHPDVIVCLPGEHGKIQIKDTREYISALHTRPLLGKYRIGIIDGADQLTAGAANAWLKTIEEPGETVVLFLIASSPVLPTIASRCQRIRFGFVSDLEMRAYISGPFQDQIIKAALGRPGRAIQFADESAYREYESDQQEVQDLLAKDEVQRLIWLAENFRRGSTQERRKRSYDLLSTMEIVLRDKLSTSREAFMYLRKSNGARQYLKANVDPRLVMEYVLLSHDTHNT